MNQQAVTQESDEHWTPKWVFDVLGLRFDLDVCAPAGGVPWIPADHHYSLDDDGLRQPWHGRVWMNPPFSGRRHRHGRTTKANIESGWGPAAWVSRFLEHGNGVCLLPHSRAKWHGILWRSGAAMVDPIDPAGPGFSFVVEGRPKSIYMPVFLAALGDDNIEALSRLGRVRL